MMKTMSTHSAFCGASASFANVQSCCANTAAMSCVHMGIILDAIMLASIIIMSALGASALCIFQILVICAPMFIMSLLACERMNILSRRKARMFV